MTFTYSITKKQATLLSQTKEDSQTESSWLGRSFKKFASTAVEVAKVGLVFGLAIGLSLMLLPIAPALAAGASCISSSTTADCQCEAPAPPAHVPNVASQSYFVNSARYMNPGKQLARLGTTACDMASGVDSRERCEFASGSLYEHYLHKSPHNERFTESDINTTHEEGVVRLGIRQDGMAIPFTFLIPARKFENYEKALKYAEATLVNDMQLFQQGANNTLQTIQKLHRILTDDLFYEKRNSPGKYRNSTKILTHKVHGKLLGAHVQQTLPLKDEYIKFVKMYGELSQKNASSFTKEDIALLNKVFFVATMPHNIDSAMMSFAEALKARMQMGGDFIDHASFAHAELTQISPFQISVGKLSRLILNTILVYAEESPVVFNNKTVYLQKVQEGTKDRKVFTDYLRNQLAWTKKNLPHLDDPIRRRIINEARYMNPGIQLVNLGRDGCDIQATAASTETCLQELSGQKKSMGHVLALHASEEASFEKGLPFTFVINGQKKKMHFDLSEHKYLNYQNALHFIEQAILSNPEILKQNAEQTLQLIKMVHYILMQRVTHEDPPSLGKYRTGWMILDGTGNPEKMIEKARDNLSRADFIKFIHLVTLVQRDVNNLGNLTEQEKAIWDTVGYIPPGPKEIEPLMTTFAQDLQSRLSQDTIDYVDLAGWTHTQIIRIFAFDEGSGRLARIFMNTILNLGKQPSVIVYNDQEYIDAVKRSIKNSVEFTKYLYTKLIPWTKKHLALLELPIPVENKFSS